MQDLSASRPTSNNRLPLSWHPTAQRLMNKMECSFEELLFYELKETLKENDELKTERGKLFRLLLQDERRQPSY